MAARARRRHRAGDDEPHARRSGVVRRFPPGVARDYDASTTATVVSSAGDATLSVADPSTTATGHLVNGAFALPQPLQARERKDGAFAAVGGSATPTNLLTYTAPVFTDTATVDFRQTIPVGEPLRTGTYARR